MACPFAKTGPDGRFSFDKPGGAYLLAAMSDDGYAEATPEGRGESGTLALQAWGKIKGRARIGRQPAANQTITFERRGVPPAGPRGVHGFYSIETRTDAQGHFSFDRVIPGAGEVSRVVVTEFGNGSRQHMGCWQEPVDVAPGQTVLVHIGGRGRPVVGRIVLRAAAGVPRRLAAEPAGDAREGPGLQPIAGTLRRTPTRSSDIAASLDKDGRFRIDDVPPGHYELTVTIDAPPGSNRPGPGQELGRVKVPVEVVQRRRRRAGRPRRDQGRCQGPMNPRDSRHPPTHRLTGRSNPSKEPRRPGIQGIQTPTDSPTHRSEQSVQESAVAEVRRSNAELLETTGACARSLRVRGYTIRAVETAQRIKSSAPGGHTLRVKASWRCLFYALGIEPLAYRKAVRAAALP